MPLPTTNISFSAIQTEFGGSNPISLSEYYSTVTNYSSGVPYLTVNAQSGSVPALGQISLNDLGGTWRIDPPVGTIYNGGAYAGLITINGLQYRVILSQAIWESSRQMTSAFFGWIGDNSTNIISTSTNNGYANTQSIKALGNSTAYPAAWYATSITGGGYTDWYLPSRDEWEICYRAFRSSNTFNNDTGNRQAIGDGLPQGTNAYSIPPRSGYTLTDPPVTTLTQFQTTGAADLYQIGSRPIDQYWTSSRSITEPAYSYTILGGSGGASLGTYHSTSKLVRPIRKELRYSEAFNSASGWAGTTISPTIADMFVKILTTGAITRYTGTVSQSGTGFTSGSTSWRNISDWAGENYNYEIRARLTTESYTGGAYRAYASLLNYTSWPALNTWGPWVQMTPAQENWIGGGLSGFGVSSSITLVGNVEIRNRASGNVIASTFNIAVTQTV